jgi:DNA processing protein
MKPGTGTLQEAVDWLLLSRTPGIGPVLLNRLAERFHHVEAVFQATDEALLSLPGITAAVVAGVRQARSAESVTAIQRELDQLARLHGQVLLRSSPLYPHRLTQIHAPPPVLFTLGDPGLLAAERVLAIVGTRGASQQGWHMAYRLAFELARQEFVLVSGLAVGIDAAVHQGALDAHGKTVAVVASGLDIVYPRENDELRQRIVAHGCIVSEAPLGMPPLAGLFPLRNRIVSGLALGVVVVEAPLRSGALITARCALEQNRLVFAVPGNVGDIRSRGGHKLLRDGARLVESVEDILEELTWLGTARCPTNSDPDPVPIPEPVPEPVSAGMALEPEWHPVHAVLLEGMQHQDELARKCQLTVADLSRILLQMELSGVVERRPGGYVVLL